MKLVCLIAGLAGALAVTAAPFPWPLPADATRFYGDPKRGAEQDAQFKESHPMIATDITWPINQGNPFTDWGHFRLSKRIASDPSLVVPLPAGEELKRREAMFALKDWQDGQLLKYSILEPDAKLPRPAVGWPLVFILPGAGGVGKQSVRGTGAARWALDYYRTNMPAIVVVLHPQQRTQNYVATGNGIEVLPAFGAYRELIDHLAGRADVDRRRISVSGHSMGGAAVWLLLRERPNLFAAAVPCAGGISSEAADYKHLTGTPIWMIMGNNDPWSGSSRYSWAYSQLLAAGHKQVRYWEVQDIGHSDGPLSLFVVHHWLWSQTREPAKRVEFCNPTLSQ